MTISRRGLFGMLAVAPVAAVKVARAEAEPQVILRPGLTFCNSVPGDIRLTFDQRTGAIVKLMRDTNYAHYWHPIEAEVK